MKKILSSAAALLLMASTHSFAGIITTTGNGSAATDVDRIATFDGISGSLLGYTEDGLSISVNDSNCCFTGVHYGSGGNNDFVTISTVDGLDFFGLELDFGTGFRDGLHNVVWETKRDGLTTGSGILNDIFASNGLRNGFSVLGWSDENLFDTLLIGAAPVNDGYNAFGQFQAIALDNVKVDFSAPISVPEPASIALLGLGLAGIGFSRKRK